MTRLLQSEFKWFRCEVANKWAELMKIQYSKSDTYTVINYIWETPKNWGRETRRLEKGCLTSSMTSEERDEINQQKAMEANVSRTISKPLKAGTPKGAALLDSSSYH